MRAMVRRNNRNHGGDASECMVEEEIGEENPIGGLARENGLQPVGLLTHRARLAAIAEGENDCRLTSRWTGPEGAIALGRRGGNNPRSFSQFKFLFHIDFPSR
jgi:hypothetical protein